MKIKIKADGKRIFWYWPNLWSLHLIQYIDKINVQTSTFRKNLASLKKKSPVSNLNTVVLTQCRTPRFANSYLTGQVPEKEQNVELAKQAYCFYV